MKRLFPITAIVIVVTAAGVLFGYRERLAEWGFLGLAQIIRDESVWLAPYVATPQEVVDRMLEIAEVRPTDVVYDLGSGDGRIVITAAKKYGARGVGFELDEKLVRRAQDHARRAGVTRLVEFRQQDVMSVDLSPATVVTLYLLQDANLRLRPIILSQLPLGARVVSHKFHMGDWRPDRTEKVQATSGDVHTLYLWRIASRLPPG